MLWRTAGSRTHGGRVLTGTVLVCLAGALLAPPPLMLAQGQGSGAKIAATLYSTLSPSGWAGYAIIVFDQKPPVVADYTCAGPLPEVKLNGALYGTETCEFTLRDGSGTLKVQNTFDALPGAAPGLYTMHTNGSIAGGTGKFQRASGQLIERAQFILPGVPPYDTVPAPALGESQGVIFGLE